MLKDQIPFECRLEEFLLALKDVAFLFQNIFAKAPFFRTTGITPLFEAKVFYIGRSQDLERLVVKSRDCDYLVRSLMVFALL